MLGNIIGGFITVLIGANLIEPVAGEITKARYYHELSGGGTNATNVTGAASTILGLTTIFFALGVMSAGVAIAVNGLRNAGVV